MSGSGSCVRSHCDISSETIYWIADVDASSASIIRLIKPACRLAIFVLVVPELEAGPESHEPDGTWISGALKLLGFDYQVRDSPDRFLSSWPNSKKVARNLCDDFVAQGNAIIFDSFMPDAEEDYLPVATAGKLRRYSYVVNAAGFIRTSVRSAVHQV